MNTQSRGTRRRGGTDRRIRWWAAIVALIVVVSTVLAVRPWDGGSNQKAAAVSTASPTVPASAAASPTLRATTSPSPSRVTLTPAPTTASATKHPTSASAAPAAASSPAPVAVPAGWRTVTFVNEVSQTIWIASGQQTAQPALTTTGWVLPAGQSLSIAVPDKWNGRFWGRTGCSFDSAGSGHCQTGDCGGKFQCSGYGSIPATLAEFNLDAWSGLDFYDVSMVDGSNLPMYINIAKGATTDKISSTGCIAAGCTKPVVCPSALRVDGGAGCESPCGVFGTDQYCCRGTWAPRSECQPTQWPVDYAAVFKQAEPYAYSYVDDDATSVFTCTGGCDYRITFGVSP